MGTGTAMSKIATRWPKFVAMWLLLAVSGAVADGNVTLQSMKIFTTHEWFGQKPEVYFRCQDEDRVDLPDVKEKDLLYAFNGLESWQPLTRLVGAKCKRCGLYERDTLKSDDTFDEWELCPLDFSPSPEGLYVRSKENEFDIIFQCPTCNVETDQDEAVTPTSKPSDKAASHSGLTAVFVVFILLCVGGLAFVAYSQWRRKQREEQHARFVKLFEDDDFLDEELGLKDNF